MVSRYRARDYYEGDVAETYDAVRTADPGAARKWRRETEVLGAALDGIEKGARVLDLPVGNARFAPLLRGHGIEWVGADVSADMLAAIAEGERDAPACAGLVLADAESAPFGDRSFDHVLCMRFLNLVPLEVARLVVAECARVSRGSVLLEVRLSRGRNVDRLLGLSLRAASRLKRRLAGGRSGAGTGAAPRRDPIQVHKASDFADVLRDAGLSVRSRHAVTPSWRPDALWILVAERQRSGVSR